MRQMKDEMKVSAGCPSCDAPPAALPLFQAGFSISCTDSVKWTLKNNEKNFNLLLMFYSFGLS